MIVVNNSPCRPFGVEFSERESWEGWNWEKEREECVGDSDPFWI